MSGFISQRKLRLQDFLPLYERNSAKIDTRRTGFGEYEHTLSTVWEMSLSNLPSAPYALLCVLAFLEPDVIDESFLIEGSKLLDDEELEFIQHEMEYVTSSSEEIAFSELTRPSLGDAEEVLLRVALIDKTMEDASLSVHRLVQAAVIRRCTKEDQSKYFDVVVRILSWGFPETWSEDVGHQFQAWAKCEMCLRHVNHLVKQAKRYKILSQNPQDYGELLLRCSW